MNVETYYLQSLIYSYRTTTYGNTFNNWKMISNRHALLLYKQLPVWKERITNRLICIIIIYRHFILHILLYYIIVRSFVKSIIIRHYRINLRTLAPEFIADWLSPIRRPVRIHVSRCFFIIVAITKRWRV